MSAQSPQYDVSSRPRRPVAAPRPKARALIVPGLWAIFMLWTGWGIVSPLFGGRPNPRDFGALLAAQQAPVLFALNLWGFAAGLLVGLFAANPFRWLNGKRLAFGGIAFAMMLGRLFGAPVITLTSMMPTPAGTPLAVIAAPFVLLLLGFIIIVITGLTLATAFGLFVGIPVTIFNQIFAFERSLHIYRYQSNGLAMYIVRAVFWLRNMPLPKAPPDYSKGARFASREETVARHNADIHKPGPMVFGHLIPDKVPFWLQTDKHVLIMASTRSGKGVTLIIPHLLRHKGSAFVLDPKGENAKATGRRRAQLNDTVHVLDPFGISGKPKSRFNPLSRFTPDTMEAESKALAAALFVVGERERDHWTAAGQQLLAAIILFVYVSPDIPPAQKDLPTVRKVLLGGLKGALEAMTEIDAADGLLRDLAISFLETPEKEFGSVVSTAQRQTEILDNPYIVACLSATGRGPEVDFRDWHRGTMTVYLCLSAPKFPTFNRWLRLVLTSALDEMTDTLKPPPLPVCFMLDELATLGHLTAVENAVGLAAGYGIQLVSVFQDVAQMRDLYKGRWASFIGNAGVRALFNLDDYDTADYWSKFIGGRLVETRGRQEDLYGFSKGDNVGEAMRPLISTDQLMMEFSSGKMLVLAQALHPVITERVPYWADQTLNGTWDDPRATAVAAKPAAPPPKPQPPAQPTPPPGNGAMRPIDFRTLQGKVTIKTPADRQPPGRR
jgi:type IV secretion system protein VirD4